MLETDKLFAGSIPEIYDRLLVPLLFESSAADLARRVAGAGGGDILEIGAGTGALTRALDAALPKDARIVATDLNAPMLERARQRMTGGARVVEWKEADALALPFADAAFDVVVAQYAVMFFPDKSKAYREARRVLREGGRYLFNVWDRLSENDVPAIISETVAAMFPDDPPRFLERTPYGYYDFDRIREELRSAGFADIAIEAVEHRSRASSARDAAVAFCQGTPLRGEIESRRPSGLEEATERATKALVDRYGSGPVDGRIRGIVVRAS